ncbi:MAG TPA: 3-hydroxyacyl-ACP dehydratase FabZ family protein [Planctomycetaceae bacterium]|nr:3-hydroxyacyl-ACP dehydratase FabZ family protein [Planctomycetaceae bacterium]
MKIIVKNENDRLSALTKSQIEDLIPHREPFLWLDEVLEHSTDRLVARKFVDPGLDVFRGHYPGKPVLPGVFLCEASMQAGAVLIALQTEPVAAGQVPVATRINNVKFKQMVRPGDTLEVEVNLTDRLASTYFLAAKVKVGGKTAATLDFACTAVEG